MLELDGIDLRPLPLIERRNRLGKLLCGAPATLIEVEAPHRAPFSSKPLASWYWRASVSKRASSGFRSGRQNAWVKVKCRLSDTFTVISFAEEAGSRPPRVGALYVGRRDGDRLLYAGKIQTGLTPRAALEPLMKATLSNPVRKPKAILLKPKLQAEVARSNVTADGMLRHGTLKGLRHDLKARLSSLG
jgi:bifunctional non-homologous end joining protein LigD